MVVEPQLPETLIFSRRSINLLPRIPSYTLHLSHFARWRQKKRQTTWKTLRTRPPSRVNLRSKPPASKSAAKHRSLRAPQAPGRGTPTQTTTTPPCRCSPSPWISSSGACGRDRWGCERARNSVSRKSNIVVIQGRAYMTKERTSKASGEEASER